MVDAPATLLLKVVALANQVQETVIDLPDLVECIQHQAVITSAAKPL